MGIHTAASGECISSISADAKLGFDIVWGDSQNADLRASRENPNCLLPGDSVFVPDKNPKQVQAPTGAVHVFRVARGRTMLLLRFLDRGAPRAGIPFTVEVDDHASNTGETDAQGGIQVPIPPNAQRATVTLLTEDQPETHVLDLGTLGPTAEMLGVQGRLSNLGYKIGELDGVEGKRTSSVIRRFQLKFQLAVTGSLDAGTIDKLRSLHDEGGDMLVAAPSPGPLASERYDLVFPDLQAGDVASATDDGSDTATPLPTARVRPAMRTAAGLAHMNTFDRRALPALLEVEDTTYHHNSAVTLPVLPTFGPTPPKPPTEFKDASATNVKDGHPLVFFDFWQRTKLLSAPIEELWRRSALVHVAVVYLFQQSNPTYRLLLSGHTDTTGTDSFNMELGDERANNFLFVLIGDRQRWIESCLHRSKVEDYQRILSYYATLFGMDCDPGEVDDQDGELTRAALRGFQRDFNQRFGKAIAVDGVAGPEVWGAFFDMYMLELAGLLGTTPDGLGAFRASLTFVDPAHRTITCGERIPIDEPQRNAFRSQKNRRVESLFFPASELPDLKPHLPGGAIRSGSAGREASPIYGPGSDPFVIIVPRWWNEAFPRDRTPQFRIDDMVLEDSESQETSIPLVAVDPAEDAQDPWAFLERFENFDPAFFDPEQMNDQLGEA
jgi:peptidoglycan hydrolase-like protein with peptidoglycan-binding domain